MTSKRLLFAATAATIALLASCSKEKATTTFCATAEETTTDGKISLNGQTLKWATGDSISIYDATAGSATYQLSTGAGSTSGVFALASGVEPGSGPYTAVYPANIRTGAATVRLPEVQHTRDGSLHELPMYAVSNNMNLKFYNLCGVVRLRLQASSAVSICRIAIATDRNTNGTATISGSGSSVAISTPAGNNVTTLSCEYGQSIASPHDFYMYLPAGTYSSFRILLTAADGSLCSKTARSSITVERGKITTINLSGLSFTEYRFSNSYSTSVVFAPGNLQYIGSAATPYWKFADRQQDYFGTATGQNSTRTDVDRDLFGWATSGWDNGNYFYMPYCTSNNFQAPYTEENGYGYGPVGGSSGYWDLYLTGAYANADWGVYNAITNGGNVAGRWRTPSGREFNHMIRNYRNTLTLNGVEGARYAMATVAGVCGLIVFPDNYSHPSGVALPVNINDREANFTGNNYTPHNWFEMEAAGAIFLPRAGTRFGTHINLNYGSYWSATGSMSNAYYISINETDFNAYGTSREKGHSVRLIRD